MPVAASDEQSTVHTTPPPVIKQRGGKPPTNAFKPGCKPGPGRPKTKPELKAAFLALVPQAVEYLGKVIQDPHTRALDRIHAAEIITDHGIGRAPQEVELSGGANLTIVFDKTLDTDTKKDG